MPWPGAHNYQHRTESKNRGKSKEEAPTLDILEPQNAWGRLNIIGERIQKLDSYRYGLVIFAADHGISTEAVSLYAPLKTSMLAEQHLRGVAPTSRLLTRLQRPELIVDVGLYNEIEVSEMLISSKVCHGSRHFIYEDGLSPEEATAALDCGARIYKEKIGDGFDIIGVGELGIANTLCAAAVAAAVTGINPDQLVGRGSTDHKVIAKKTEIIYRAFEHRIPDSNHLTDILARFGGLEIAALTGFMVEACRDGKLVMLDGYVTAVAALLANLLDDQVSSCLIAPSLSDQRGHQLVLDKIGLEAVFNLGINYGEGLAAALGMFLGEIMMQ